MLCPPPHPSSHPISSWSKELQRKGQTVQRHLHTLISTQTKLCWRLKGDRPRGKLGQVGPGPLYDFTMTGGGYLAQTLPGLGIGQERQRNAVGVQAGREFLRSFRACAIRCHPIIWQVALLTPTCQCRPSTTKEHSVPVPQGYPSSGHPQSTTHPGPPVLEPSTVCGDSHSRLSVLSSTLLSWQRGQLSHHHQARSR